MIKQAASSVVSLVCPPRLSRRLFLLAHSLLLAGLAAAQSPPTISKAFSAASVAKNQSVTLTFTITNPNPATDLTNVAFSDNLPSGLIIANPDSLVPDPVLGNCDPTGTTGVITPAPSNISLTGGQIPANATCTFSIDVLAISGGDQVNTTGPISSTEGGTGGTATATVTVVVADLTITKTHVGNFQRGQVGAVYTITVTNSGGADTDSQVTVTDTLPVGLTATTISGSNWTCTAPPTLKCTRLDALSPGLSFEDITLTVNVAGTAALTVTNTAVVSGGGEVNTSNDTATDPTTVIPEPDLTITKTHSGSFVPGQTGTYTITVSNVGAGPTAGTVTIVDTLPSPLTATAMSGTGWTCTLGTLTCTRVDVLAAGASYPAITLTVNVPAGASGTVANTAKVSGGGEINTANDTAIDQTHVGTAAIQITAAGGSLQVPIGGSSSMVFQVDAASGLGAITLSCGGLPPGTSCSFNPASESQISAQVTMIVTASAGSSSFVPHVPGRLPPAVYVASLLLLALAGFVTTRRYKRRSLQLAFAIAVLALLVALMGCGGKGTPGALPGSFPITVTGTSGTGATGSTTVTLTVF